MRINPRQIVILKKKGVPLFEITKNLKISRFTVWRWLKRARTIAGNLSSRNLDRKSTRPKISHRYSFSSQERVLMEAYRRKTRRGAIKIKHRLQLKASVRTIHRFLSKHQLVREYNYYRRPRFQNTIHMHAKNTPTVGYLQFDVKYITPELSGLTWTCFEYAVIDIFSRYKEAVILNHLDQDGSMAAILEMLPKLPFKPIFIQTDNGLEFQGRFHQMCLDMNLKHHMIHKSSPNENALIERSFRTDEEEFFFLLEKAPSHYDELRLWFSDWLHEYNYERPHLSLELKTPHEIVANVLAA